MLHTGLRLYRSNWYYGRTPLSAFALPPVHADVAAAAVLFALALAALPRPRVLAQRGRAARAAAAVRALAPRSGAGSATQRREVRPLCVVLAHANGIVRSAARARGRRAETLQG